LVRIVNRHTISRLRVPDATLLFSPCELSPRFCYGSPVYESAPRFQIERGTLPAGDAGIWLTLEKMRRLSRDGSRHPVVKFTALRVLRRARVTARDARRALAALFGFVRDSMTFVPDPSGLELLQSPRATLHRGAGDCDDLSILIVALARAAGVPADFRFRVIGADRIRPHRFSHVFVVARLGREAIAMDAIRRRNRFGWQHPAPSRIAEVPA